jgi:hypothetical protein
MRGRPPGQTLKDAITLAFLRGMVQVCVNDPERVFDFTITRTVPISFVKVRFCPKVLDTIAMIAEDFKEDIRLLRFVTNDPTISLELWLRSRYGTWRFFRVNGESVIEINRQGNPMEAKPISS